MHVISFAECLTSGWRLPCFHNGEEHLTPMLRNSIARVISLVLPLGGRLNSSVPFLSCSKTHYLLVQQCLPANFYRSMPLQSASPVCSLTLLRASCPSSSVPNRPRTRLSFTAFNLQLRSSQTPSSLGDLSVSASQATKKRILQRRTQKSSGKPLL